MKSTATDTATEPAESQNGSELDAGSVDEPTADRLFEILKNERRRMMLRYLRDADGVATRTELAEHVAATEEGIPVSEVTPQERKRVYVSLYQFHLPKMVDAGVVRIDDSDVVLTDTADQFLRRLDPDPRPWSRYYVGLSIFGIAAFVVSTVLNAGVTVAFGMVVVGLSALAALHARTGELRAAD